MHPVAFAAASKQEITFGFSSATSSLVSACTQYSMTDFSGIMLGLVPPSLIIPWILIVGFSCCHNTEMLLYANTAASKAFIPSHGNAAACAALPLNVTLNFIFARNTAFKILCGQG